MQSKRIKTKYVGVCYRETTTNNRKDKVYYIIYKENGKTKEVKIGKHSHKITAKDAHDMRISILNSIRLGEDTVILNKNKKQHDDVLTFDDAAYQYFESKHIHNKTNYRSKTKYESQLQQYIGFKKLHYILKKDILAIQLLFINENRAPKTVNQYIQFIRTVFNYAIEEKLYNGTNPAVGIKELKIDNSRERYLEIDEVKSLIKNVVHDADLHLFTLLSLSTGARLATIMSIRKKDVILHQNMLNLSDHKNQTGYKGFFDDEFKAIIENHIKNLNANDLIIATNIRTLRRKMSEILTRLFNDGLDKNDRKNRVVVHTLRHTFASQLAIAGTPIFTIQKLLNHKDIKQTLRYAKLSPDSGSSDVRNMMSIYNDDQTKNNN